MGQESRAGRSDGNFGAYTLKYFYVENRQRLSAKSRIGLPEITDQTRIAAGAGVAPCKFHSEHFCVTDDVTSMRRSLEMETKRHRYLKVSPRGFANEIVVFKVPIADVGEANSEFYDYEDGSRYCYWSKDRSLRKDAVDWADRHRTHWFERDAQYDR
ncbi:MAG: hypothetical protein J0I16_23925 [Rhizobiales bacterium]|nr:hypothetical protein [Hyphomicrobiales bacterium]